MTHLAETQWHGYVTEDRRVELTITSDLAFTDIASAQLRIKDQAAVTLTPQTAAGGYRLVANIVTLPATAGYYAWSAEVTDTAGNTPIVVAAGNLRVNARVPVAP